MPCFSTIKTKLTDGARLIDALRSLGFNPEKRAYGDVIRGTDKRGLGITFEKAGGTYSARGETQYLAAISRKYAELGVREWAKRKGYSIGIGGNLEEDAPRAMTLINRREG